MGTELQTPPRIPLEEVFKARVVSYKDGSGSGAEPPSYRTVIPANPAEEKKRGAYRYE